MEECFLTEEHQAKPEQMCEVACQDPGKVQHFFCYWLFRYLYVLFLFNMKQAWITVQQHP